jgi:hypothetical protein
MEIAIVETKCQKYEYRADDDPPDARVLFQLVRPLRLLRLLLSLQPISIQSLQ